MLDAATEVLRVHGPSEIKARVIADAVGGSTIAIYHHFGGVPELVDAVVARGFTDLLSRFESTGTLAGDPAAELFAMALMTRDLAHSNAHLYDLMFGLSTRGTYRTLAAGHASPSARFKACYALFIGACQRLIDTGRVGLTDADSVAGELWSAVHGFVTLEAAGHFSEHSAPLESILRPLAERILIGMGDDPQRVEHSAHAALDWARQRAASQGART
ncbi:TetR/AcrR family transcriptional regulator [Rhodococcus sp. IEGM 1408]|uniref:TetR/AcrR family transcriptional regulator n=1 Tax=Rhodococcus sp. IEGM 1408 TaxID=3082220 RepID=UPI0029538F4B|nr:WHG domain-containing protein [Rhodococcus sp. IEGM 1408]MDV8001420.1 WHG domain-containing protein [Rhodococcus sp. IEGM 1408]